MIQTIAIITVLFALVLFFVIRKKNKANDPLTYVKQARRERFQRAKVQAARKIEQPVKVEPPLDEDIVLDTLAEEALDMPTHFDQFDEQLTQYMQTKKPVVKEVKVEPIDIPEIINLYIIADKDRPFAGHELLQNLLTAGLRFGAMNIFHRHVEAQGNGPILFSLASSHNPGSFDLSNMGNFSCHGLSLFMQLSMVDNGLETFNLMLATARQLAKSLGGELRVGRDVILTDSLIEQFRQQARAYSEQQYAVV